MAPKSQFHCLVGAAINLLEVDVFPDFWRKILARERCLERRGLIRWGIETEVEQWGLEVLGG